MIDFCLCGQNFSRFSVTITRSMEKSAIDLAGFPVLRIDQIKDISTEMLQRAEIEASDLLSSINLESRKSGSAPPLAYYLGRQLKAMEEELAYRSARYRINALLNEEYDLKEQVSGVESTMDYAISAATQQSVESTANSRTIGKNYDDISLTSSHIAEIQESVRFVSSSTKITRSGSSTRSGNRNPSSAPSSTSNVSEPFGSKDSRRLTAMYQNFGNTFVVGGNENKLRFFPSKQVEVNPEEVKRKERQLRRAAAMKRLMERQVKRKKELEDAYMTKKHDAAASNSTLGASSGLSKDEAALLRAAMTTDDIELQSNPAPVASNLAMLTAAAPGRDSDDETVSGGDDVHITSTITATGAEQFLVQSLPPLEVAQPQPVVRNRSKSKSGAHDRKTLGSSRAGTGRLLNSKLSSIPIASSVAEKGGDIDLSKPPVVHTSGVSQIDVLAREPRPHAAQDALSSNLVDGGVSAVGKQLPIEDDEDDQGSHCKGNCSGKKKLPSISFEPLSSLPMPPNEVYLTSLSPHPIHPNPLLMHPEIGIISTLPELGPCEARLIASNVDTDRVQQQQQGEVHLYPRNDRSDPSVGGDGSEGVSMVSDHATVPLISKQTVDNEVPGFLHALEGVEQSDTNGDKQDRLRSHVAHARDDGDYVEGRAEESQQWLYDGDGDRDSSDGSDSSSSSSSSSSDVMHLGESLITKEKTDDLAENDNHPFDAGVQLPNTSGIQRTQRPRDSKDGISSSSVVVATTARATGKAIAAVAPKSLSTARLTEFFPHIGTLFPGAYNYNQTGPRPIDLVTARMLLESMSLQAKLYDEWMDVMSDYATVFSEDRTIPANVPVSQRSAQVYKGGSRALHYRIKSSRMEVQNIISDVLRNDSALSYKWEELPNGLGLGLSWNLLWTWSKPRINMAHLLVWQRVNHFVDSKQLTRKDLLKKNLQRYAPVAPAVSSVTNDEKSAAAPPPPPSYFEIMPLTFLLPREYTQLVKAFTETAASLKSHSAKTTAGCNFWIMKPIGLSRGRGISLVTDINTLTYSQASVIQRYIERPLCLNGYKFDLRLYVLVTSFRPLEAFIYKEGFARLSTQQYSLALEDVDNKFIHLTNSSIQKQNAEGPTDDNPLVDKGGTQDTGGSKMALLGNFGLWARLTQHGIDIEKVWNDICLLVVKSLVAVEDKFVYQPCSFEVFGYDVLIDSDLRPWLLEVNASPSLARDNALDTRVKNAMIRDTILLLDPAPFDRASVTAVFRRRLGELAKKKYSGPSANSDPDLESDLRDILGDFIPRKYGESPKELGEYVMLCPNTKMYNQVLKMKSKMFKPMDNT